MNKIRVSLVLVLIGLMLTAVAVANTVTTAPYSLREEDNQKVSTQANGKVESFPHDREYRHVTVTNKWLYQARIDGMGINIHLYAPNGNGVMFQENICEGSDKESVRLVLRQENQQGGVLLQLDQSAMDMLRRIGITEITVVDSEYYIQNTYQVAMLQNVRDMLGLRDGDELSVSGLEDPVSVVDANGVRRIISE